MVALWKREGLSLSFYYPKLENEQNKCNANREKEIVRIDICEITGIIPLANEHP